MTRSTPLQTLICPDSAAAVGRYVSLSPRPALPLLGFVLGGIVASSLLTGCGMNSRLIPQDTTAAAAHISGVVHGGQQPVSGATIQLYAAGLSGDRSSATPLLTTTVVTDQNGSFNISGDYTCPAPDSQVYLTATGGNPGLTGNVNNTAIALVTVLGDCSALASTTQVSISEVTTAAAAWALAPFAASTSPIANVGVRSSNPTGLRNAMGTAMMLADNATGVAPSAQLPAGATIEAAKLYTVANLLAACVNSNGGVACTQLFTDAAGPGSPAPTDVFGAALSIASNPSHNVAALFADLPPQTAFGNNLSAAPSDFTMSISFTGGGLNLPAGVSIDTNGNPWVAGAGGHLYNFSSQGVPMTPNGIGSGTLHESFSVTIDPNGNVWVANQQNTSSFPVDNGSVSVFTPQGAMMSGSTGFTNGAINQPVFTASDFVGHMWIANYGSSTVSVLDQQGNPLSGVNGWGAGVLSKPLAVVVDDFNNAWISSGDTPKLTKYAGDGTLLKQISCCMQTNAMALDSVGTVWAGSNTSSQMTWLTPLGAILSSNITGGGLNSPQGIAVDGADHLWISNVNTGVLSEIAATVSVEGAGTPLSPSSGLGVDAHMSQLFGTAVDASGNVWASSFGDNRLVKFVGLASPVKTPLVGLPRRP